MRFLFLVPAIAYAEPNIIRLPDIAGIINSISTSLASPSPRRTISQTLFGFATNPEPLTEDNVAMMRNYKVNERGQFLDVTSFAQAMTDQLGIPLPLASRLAELNQNFARQLKQINSAVAEWASEDRQAAEEQRLAASADNSDDLVYPLVGNMIQNMVNRLTAGMRVPVKHELDAMEALIETLSPIVLN